MNYWYIWNEYQCLWILWWRTLTLKGCTTCTAKRPKMWPLGDFQDGFLYLHCHWHYKCTTHGLLQYFWSPKPWDECPHFVWQMKEGFIGISKYKIFFKSVEGKFWGFSEKIWTGFPRALPPGIRMKLEDKKFKCRNPSLHCYFWTGFLVLKDILVESSIIYNWLWLCSNEKPKNIQILLQKCTYFPRDMLHFTYLPTDNLAIKSPTYLRLKPF